MSRLRQAPANTARGAAHFLRETVGRVRYAGAAGPLTVRADSGFYTHAIVAVCRKMDVRFSITSASTPGCATSSRPYPRLTGHPYPTGWTAPPTWLKPPTRPSRVSPTPHRCASSSPAAIRPADLALLHHLGRSTFLRRGRHTPHRPFLSASGPRKPFPWPLIPRLTGTAGSLRWMRAQDPSFSHS